MRFSTLAITFCCSIALGIWARRADAFFDLPPPTTIAAMQGHGWPNHFDSCFGSAWALMRNNCGGPVGSQRLLIIPTVASSKKHDPVWVSASGNGIDGMTNCQGIAPYVFNEGQRAIGFTQIVSTNVSSSIQWLKLGSIQTYPYGTLHFECFVAQGGGSVYTITVF